MRLNSRKRCGVLPYTSSAWDHVLFSTPFDDIAFIYYIGDRNATSDMMIVIDVSDVLSIAVWHRSSLQRCGHVNRVTIGSNVMQVYDGVMTGPAASFLASLFICVVGCVSKLTTSVIERTTSS